MALAGFSQDTGPLGFGLSKQRLNDSLVVLTIHVKVQPGVKLYALQKDSSDLIFSSVLFDSSSLAYLKDKVSMHGNVHTERDSELDADVQFFTDSVVLTQHANIRAQDSVLIKGVLNCLYKKNGEYLPREEPFKFFVVPVRVADAGTAAGETRSLWWIFFTAFAGGLLAIVTPCVYAMVPITVSFFTKRSKTRAEGIRNSVFYSSSIVGIFTVFGFLITFIFGPAALNNLATNWIANLFFFAVFLIFGISFLGAFEISLPSSWSQKSDTYAGTKSFGGIFFMALTLVIVSFSCTGPIIGNLLVLAAKGNYFGPLIGMFGFSLALALPFAFFAFFPGALNSLARSGGWLNTVKVTLGFLELALALKFLSNADLSKGWRLLDREVYLSLWIVIFLFLGLYLIGEIRFHHDDDLPKNDFNKPYLTIPRTFFAIAAFSFTIYMIPGLWGASLKGISAFLPPMGTQDFNIATVSPASLSTGAEPLPRAVKYAERMKIYEPEVVVKYGMVTYFDYDEALTIARKLHKPLMIDFTGINCVNCRKMEAEVWSDPQVMKKLKENFVIVSLYVDVQNIDLPENEQFFSKVLDKKIETLGDKTVDFQVSKFNANVQPYYFFLDNEEKKLEQQGYGYDPDVQKFIGLLERVTTAFNQRN